ncbi:hypothetical protein BV898_17384 [Hypsibius exemplaris]|uniref:Uncharacterized protein n=1 Tax=Hypsibius exemplaris TaxID=2072580 RepID=A0A9X6RMI5_HYPEX|nr:hypothetical protein BV898_17384 [Hypsibius exemplaris]
MAALLTVNGGKSQELIPKNRWTEHDHDHSQQVLNSLHCRERMQSKQPKTPNMDMANSIYEKLPAFTDIFDEETFYITAIAVVIGAFLAAFIMSRFVKLDVSDY